LRFKGIIIFETIALFYVTNIYGQAEFWAKRKGKTMPMFLTCEVHFHLSLTGQTATQFQAMTAHIPTLNKL